MLIEFGSLSEASSSDGDQGLRVRRVGRMDGNAVKLVVEKVIDDGVQSRESKLQIFVGLRVELQLSMVLIERQVRELREGRAELDAAEAGERIQICHRAGSNFFCLGVLRNPCCRDEQRCCQAEE